MAISEIITGLVFFSVAVLAIIGAIYIVTDNRNKKPTSTKSKQPN